MPPRRRLVALGAVTLIAPAILLYEGVSRVPYDAPVIAGFSGLLFLLVILRLWGLVVVHRRAVARERVLRAAGEALVAAVRPEQVTEGCARAVEQLLGPLVPHRTVLLPSERAPGPAHGTARLVTPRELGPRLGGGLDGMEHVLVCPMAPPDRAAGEAPGVLLVAGPAAPLGRPAVPWRSSPRTRAWRWSGSCCAAR